MNLNDINAITSSQYGFKVFDWDDNRGGSDGAGQVLLEKIDFDGCEYGAKNIFEITGLAFTVTQKDLKGLTDQAIADLFNTIIRKYENIELNGKTYWPMSIHLRVSANQKIPAKPFLFILGREQSTTSSSITS